MGKQGHEPAIDGMRFITVVKGRAVGVMRTLELTPLSPRGIFGR